MFAPRDSAFFALVVLALEGRAPTHLAQRYDPRQKRFFLTHSLEAAGIQKSLSFSQVKRGDF
jgi:hypothetical protein